MVGRVYASWTSRFARRPIRTHSPVFVFCAIKKPPLRGEVVPVRVTEWLSHRSSRRSMDSTSLLSSMNADSSFAMKFFLG